MSTAPPTSANLRKGLYFVMFCAPVVRILETFPVAGKELLEQVGVEIGQVVMADLAVRYHADHFARETGSGGNVLDPFPLHQKAKRIHVTGRKTLDLILAISVAYVFRQTSHIRVSVVMNRGGRATVGRIRPVGLARA